MPKFFWKYGILAKITTLAGDAFVDLIEGIQGTLIDQRLYTPKSI